MGLLHKLRQRLHAVISLWSPICFCAIVRKKEVENVKLYENCRIKFNNLNNHFSVGYLDFTGCLQP